MLKDTDEQPGETDTDKVDSGRVPRTGASVPVEVGWCHLPGVDVKAL